MKYSISYSRTVETVPYENIKVNLTQEFDDEEIKPDLAYSLVKDKVGKWIETELIMMGLK